MGNDIVIMIIKHTTYMSVWLNCIVILRTQIYYITLWHVEMIIHHPSMSVISIMQFIMKLEKKDFCKSLLLFS